MSMTRVKTRNMARAPEFRVSLNNVNEYNTCM
jgi:hypothetical protein